MNIETIHPLLANHYGKQARAIDTGDGAAWADSYTAGGTYDSPSYEQVFTGREELIGFGNSFPERSPNATHLVNNMHITEFTETTANVVLNYVIVSGEPGQQCTILRTVTAFDQIDLREGQPRIISRRIEF